MGPSYNNSLKLVKELGSKKINFDGLGKTLSQVESNSSSTETQRLFTTIKNNLSSVVYHINSIINFDPDKLADSNEQALNVQLHANQIQKNLVEARMNLDEIAKTKDIDELAQCFEVLVTVYQVDIQNYHSHTRRLDQIEVSLDTADPDDASRKHDRAKMLELNRSMHVSALLQFLKLEEGTVQTEMDKLLTNKLSMNDSLLSLYSSITQDQSPLLESLSIDLNRYRQNPENISEDLIEFAKSISNIFDEIPSPRTDLKNLNECLCDKGRYEFLQLKILKKLMKNQELKLSEVMKTILSLRSLFLESSKIA